MLQITKNELNDYLARSPAHPVATGLWIHSKMIARHVNVLILKDLKLPDEAFVPLFERLKDSRCLEIVTVAGNKLNASGFNLAIALTLNNSLRQLDLRNNHVGERGVRSLIVSSMGHQKLKALGVSGNKGYRKIKQSPEYVELCQKLENSGVRLY